MKMLALIPARGGSKRIPHKNIRPFCGREIIACSIEAALESALFSEVMVSTDDEEIAAVAKKYGAAVPFMRSSESASDTATTAGVIEEVLRVYEERGLTFDACCCIYATAPFVTAKRLREAHALLSGKECDAVLPVVRFDYPPQRGLLMDEDGQVRYWFPENEKKRSQDLETVYHDCGQFYFFKTAPFLAEKTLVPKRTVSLVLPASEVQDIDTPEDWEAAEEKYLRLMKRGKDV